MIVTRTYQNGLVREYDVLSVSVQDGNMAIMHTSCSGDVAVSLQDTPEIWQQLTTLIGG